MSFRDRWPQLLCVFLAAGLIAWRVARGPMAPWMDWIVLLSVQLMVLQVPGRPALRAWSTVSLSAWLFLVYGSAQLGPTFQFFERLIR